MLHWFGYLIPSSARIFDQKVALSGNTYACLATIVDMKINKKWRHLTEILKIATRSANYNGALCTTTVLQKMSFVLVCSSISVKERGASPPPPPDLFLLLISYVGYRITHLCFAYLSYIILNGFRSEFLHNFGSVKITIILNYIFLHVR